MYLQTLKLRTEFGNFSCLPTYSASVGFHVTRSCQVLSSSPNSQHCTVPECLLPHYRVYISLPLFRVSWIWSILVPCHILSGLGADFRNEKLRGSTDPSHFVTYSWYRNVVRRTAVISDVYVALFLVCTSRKEYEACCVSYGSRLWRNTFSSYTFIAWRH